MVREMTEHYFSSRMQNREELLRHKLQMSEDSRERAQLHRQLVQHRATLEWLEDNIT